MIVDDQITSATDHLDKTYSILLEGPEETVCTETPNVPNNSAAYQSEAELEAQLIKQLCAQGYEHVQVHTQNELIANLRHQIENLNGFAFTDADWETFFQMKIANASDGIVEKTRLIQHSPVIDFTTSDGTLHNVMLLDRNHIHRNQLQVLNQYEANEGTHKNRYDVTILVNGLPLVHIELKRRGVDLRQAFNQIERYQRESFWSQSGLFEYVQLFIISNGSLTKYYSNTTRWQKTHDERGKKTSASYQFTSWWTDAKNHRIMDLVPFTASFLSRGTLLMILTHYCVLDVDDNLLVMRPYQICATERILNRILISEISKKRLGTSAAGGYIWHTTGSGKTLTSFKTAILASQMEGINKVLFVVDRKDLDYQTMKEYNKFQPGAVNGSTNTAALTENLESNDPDKRICVTTIQKLAVYLSHAQKGNPLFAEHVVFIFDECHRSQFGKMHKAITSAFKNYHLFGFTGTPIFAKNAQAGGDPELKTTQQAFGDCLHKYTVVNAIDDGNVLPFKVDYVKTFSHKDGRPDEQVEGIDTNTAWQNPKRIRLVSEYILNHYAQKTKRDSAYQYKDTYHMGLNSILACDSISSAKAYYSEIQSLLANYPELNLKVATIFTYAPNGEDDDAQGMLTEEQMDTAGMEPADRDFLDSAIADYNMMFKSNFGTDGRGFDSYYKDVSRRMKNRDLDLLIVVDMFLTGFDAKTLNTLWVDKNLRLHGLIQAFSRTNRILNSVKTFGNIVCFRDLSDEVDEALGLFGDPDAAGIVLLKPYEDYFSKYAEALTHLRDDFPLDSDFSGLGEKAEKDFIKTFGALLRLRNILTCFDQFAADDPLKGHDRELQDYQSHYLDLADKYKRRDQGERVSIGDDLVFEMELVKQVEVNIDYILMLVEQYHGENTEDKQIADTIRSSVASSPELRDKADLIDAFLQLVGFGDKDPIILLKSLTSQERHEVISDQWKTFIADSMEKELDSIIESHNLKPSETRSFMSEAFISGGVTDAGTAIRCIMKPISRFAKGNPYAEQRQDVVDSLTAFYSRYKSLTPVYPMVIMNS
ncbi:type I restriction endonuclease subunit R [Bifidobacterium sp. ESL0745]|uniref:type I restriction endonuclease subunit R n=1 Tax=Bifidobacterium sp. ESL0745 TaxID=2983226 RepID=UPI0023F73CEE|nr:type I restriction endonuclease subunit R [Bifidobacterium sp. ESL0745]MDF7665349.1 type I restriction endonuclease subunit R [Bifidobacterium sp. ESL0745]